MRVAVPIRVPERVCVATPLWAPRARLGAARRRATQCTRALLLCATWLLTSWLGPAVLPAAGWTWEQTAVAAAAYALLTASVVAALAVAALSWAFDPMARLAVRARLGSAAWPLLLAAPLGLLVAHELSHRPLLAGWLGVVTGLAALVAIVAVTCHHEHARLRSLRKGCVPLQGDSI